MHSGAWLVVALAGHAVLAADPVRSEGRLLACGYTRSIVLTPNSELSKHNPERTRFELRFDRSFIVPDFCDTVVQSLLLEDTYFVSCRSGEYPATITHDITVNKTTGAIVTVMTFFADNKWVSKVAHLGRCAFE